MPIDPRDVPRVRALLAGASWLAGCQPHTLDILLANAFLVRFRKGSVISMRGEPHLHLSIVIEGSVAMSHGTLRGRRFVSTITPPGEPFGFVGLIDGKGSIHEIRAHEPTLLLRVPKVDLTRAMQMDTVVLDSVLLLLSQRLRGLQSSLFEASMLPLATRLARLLMLLSRRYGVRQEDGGHVIGLRVAQDDLAAMLGVTRQRLNMELKRMERERVLKLSYARIVLLDETKLAGQAEEQTD